MEEVLIEIMPKLKKALSILVSEVLTLNDSQEFVEEFFNFPQILFKCDEVSDGKGMYRCANDVDFSKLVKNMNFEERERAKNCGVIVICGRPEDYSKNNRVKSLLLLTLIHEHIHAFRNVLVTDYFRFDTKTEKMDNKSAYTYFDNVLVKNTINISTRQGDINQDFIKGSVDSSSERMGYYINNTMIRSKENRQICYQIEIDEAFVELVSLCGYYMCLKELRGEPYSIFDELYDISEEEESTLTDYLVKMIANKVLDEDNLSILASVFHQGYGCASIDVVHYDYMSRIFSEEERNDIKKRYNIWIYKQAILDMLSEKAP